MLRKLITISVILAAIAHSSGFAQSAQQAPLLTVKQIMNGIITPATSTIWGAYQLETETQWQEVANAALAVIGAGDLLRAGGAGSGEVETAGQEGWRSANQQMLAAAREVLRAVEQRDEEALAVVGNDALYPPCESCHQRYQNR